MSAYPDTRERALPAAIAEFPQDGTPWWIRWIGKCRNSHTRLSGPVVDVYLERLREGVNYSRDQLVAASVMRFPLAPDPIVRTVAVGNLPDFALGGIYCNGLRSGAMAAPTGTFTLDHREPEHFPIKIGDLLRSPLLPSLSLREDSAYMGQFRVPDHDSYVLVLRQTNSDAHVIIPCLEIFRSFFGVETEMARALLSGPWPLVQSRIINPSRTLVRDDGSWELGLRPRIHDDSVPTIANLCFSDAGQAAARRIYGSMADSERDWNMVAKFPMPEGDLSLKMRYCILDNMGTILCTQICGAEWPHEEPILYSRDNDGRTGQEQFEHDGPPPYSNSGRLEADISAAWIENCSEEDPFGPSKSVLHPSPQSLWSNLPHIERITKERSAVYKEGFGNGEVRPLKRTSSGTPQFGESESTPGAFSQSELGEMDVPSRFEQVMSLFDRFVKYSALKEWSAFCSNSTRKHYVQGYPVWTLPQEVENQLGDVQKKSWASIGKAYERPRVALIARLVKLIGPPIYWIEVEPTPNSNGTFRALLLASSRSGQALQELLDEALYLCVQRRGVWPPIREIITRTGAESAATWRHIGSTRGTLNYFSALSAIQSLSTSVQGNNDAP
jgi:hypothetical protein